MSEGIKWTRMLSFINVPNDSECSVTDRLVDFIVRIVKSLIHAFEVVVVESLRKIFHHVHCVIFMLLIKFPQDQSSNWFYSLRFFFLLVKIFFCIFRLKERTKNWIELSEIGRVSRRSRARRRHQKSSPGAISRYSREEHGRSVSLLNKLKIILTYELSITQWYNKKIFSLNWSLRLKPRYSI